jgi:hypothetical protein
MHLLPKELGGPKLGTNFVPAPHYKNQDFYNAFEHSAAKKFGSISDGKEVGSYAIDLSRYEGSASGYVNGVYPEGFPRTLRGRWATYKHKGTGNGKSRSEWKRGPETLSKVVRFDPPPLQSRPAPNINQEQGMRNIQAAIGYNEDLINAVLTLRAEREFSGIADMKQRLKGYTIPGGHGKIEEKYIKRVERYSKAGRFTFT